MRISLLALFYAYEFVYKVVRTKQVKAGTRVTHRPYHPPAHTYSMPIYQKCLVMFWFFQPRHEFVKTFSSRN